MCSWNLEYKINFLKGWKQITVFHVYHVSNVWKPHFVLNLTLEFMVQYRNTGQKIVVLCEPTGILELL